MRGEENGKFLLPLIYYSLIITQQHICVRQVERIGYKQILRRLYAIFALIVPYRYKTSSLLSNKSWLIVL